MDTWHRFISDLHWLGSCLPAFAQDHFLNKYSGFLSGQKSPSRSNF